MEVKVRKNQTLLSKSYTIAIVGPHYSGKSTLCKILKNELGLMIFEEKWWENPFINDLPIDFFRSQFWFLQQNLKSMRKALNLREKGKSTALDTFIYSNPIFASTKLTSREYKVFEDVFGLIVPNEPLPDLVVYLYADVNFLYNVRRQSRIEDGTGPKEDAKTEFEWFKKICDLNQEEFANWRKTKLLKVNVAVTDFKHNKNHRDKLVKAIVNKLESSNNIAA